MKHPIKSFLNFLLTYTVKDFELESDGSERLCIVQETDPDAIKGSSRFYNKGLVLSLFKDRRFGYRKGQT